VTLAVLNSKGGVGKTTTAVGLAAALAAPRRRVLLVDLDSQACASHWCGVSRNQLRPSAASVLLEKYPILKAIRHTAVPHLDLLTGSLELANADVALAAVRGREVALRRALERVLAHYELLVLDCPPAFTLLGINAILAADAVIVPVSAEPMAVAPLDALLASFERVRARMQAGSRLLGIVLTQLDPRRPLNRETAERVRAEYRDRVFHTDIRWSAALAASPGARRPPATNDAYKRLGGEVLQRLHALRPHRAS
jgi:chromosome partitioning protein